MYAIDIIIENNNFKDLHDQQYEDWIQWSYEHIYQLERSGQILKTNCDLVLVSDHLLKVSVLSPEIGALNIEHCTSYNIKLIQKIENITGTKIRHVVIGRDVDNPTYSIPAQPSFYVLRSGWASPIICGDTHQPIPLYKVFSADSETLGYDDIYFWQRDYERLHGLWISSGDIYEDFAESQLQDVHSAINVSGRALCEQIELVTGVPTYYFLFNNRGWTEEEDRHQKCPISNQNWLLEGKTISDFIAFRCVESRLVSELSYNADTEKDNTDSEKVKVDTDKVFIEPKKTLLEWASFLKVDMSVGTILSAEPFAKAKNSSYLLMIDFGPLGVMKSAAQITERYSPMELVGKQVIAVINFPPKQIANIMSECLVLAAVDEFNNTILIQPDRKTNNGSRIS